MAEAGNALLQEITIPWTTGSGSWPKSMARFRVPNTYLLGINWIHKGLVTL